MNDYRHVIPLFTKFAFVDRGTSARDPKPHRWRVAFCGFERLVSMFDGGCNQAGMLANVQCVVDVFCYSIV